MDAVKRFFRKYLLSTIGILVLFFGLNIIMVIGILASANRNSTDPAIHISQIGDSITLSESGEIISDKMLSELLKNKNAWAMMLNQSGDIVWQERVPEEIPSQYTVTDVAKFSRWYLQDYPVYILEHPAGLLVVGCEPNSLQKYNLSLDTRYISTIIMGVGIAVIANALLMVFLILRNTLRIEKSVIPILTGIETISQGKSVSLIEKGELAEINMKLNRAGRYIVQKDKARAEWINGISHDVRTPLSIMLGYASEIADDLELPLATRTQAGIIKKQGEKLRGLIADLNLASKLEYSMQPLHIETIYPLELVRQVISGYLNNNIEEKYSFDLLSTPGADSLFIRGDNALLTRLLDNLIGNSIRHNPNGCIITVDVKQGKNSCIITIADNGIGINSKQQESLNSGAFQLHEKTGEATHGFGLRLSSQIVQAHNGTIHFANIKPHGLLVDISLPIK